MTLSVYPLLKRRQRSAFFILEIDGLGTRFYGPRGTPPTVSPYTYKRGLVEVSTANSSLSLLGGIEEGGTVEVTIGITDENNASGLLLRLGARGAARRVRLAETLPKEARGAASALPSVDVEGSLSSWPSSGVFWVGQEAIAYTGTSESAGVWSFTGLTRGYYDSQTQRHEYEPDNGRSPWITDSCVSWRTRRARLKMGWAHADGSSPTNFWTVCSGFIDESPQTTGDGNAITLAIVPWTHALNQEIGGKSSQTQLQHGWHHFTADTGSSIVYEMLWKKGDCIDEKTNPGAVGLASDTAASNKIHTPSGGTGGVHDTYFDVALAATHPRRGLLEAGSNLEVTPTGYGAAGGTNIPYIAVTMSNAVTNFQGVKNLEAKETYIVPFAGFGLGDERLLKWPGDVLDILNTDADVSTTSGAGGRWARLQWVEDIDWPDGGRGPAIVANLNGTLAPAGPLTLRFLMDYDLLWFGLDHAAPDEGRYVRPPIQRGQRSPRRDGPSVNAEYFTHEITSTDERQQVLPLRGMAYAWYQTGESVLLCEDNILGSPSTSYPRWVRIEYEPIDPQDGNQIDGGKAFTYLEVDDVTSTSDDGVTMYKYSVTDRSRVAAYGFGDFPGYERCIVRPVVRLEEQPATDIMLTLLLSDEGDGTNSVTYDTAPFGANMTTSEVDVDSFTRFPLPGPMRSLTLDIVEGRPVIDYVAPMLQRMGASLVMRTNPTTGARKLTLIPTGPENALNAIDAVANNDWTDDPIPTTTDDEILNRYVYKVNYNWRTRRFDLTVRFDDRDSQQETGEVRDVDVEVFGLYLPLLSPSAQQAALAPLFKTQRGLMGVPRRTWSGTLAHADTLTWYPGATVVLSASDAYGVDGARGLSIVAARVAEMRTNPYANETQITLVSAQANGAGWAPALRSSTVGTVTDVIVNANRFTAAEHPQTGNTQTDLGYLDEEGSEQPYFQVGDVVDIFPRGNFAARVQRTIGDVDWTTNTITLTASVTISVGDIIRPAAYDSASDHHKTYAYLADNDSALGAADVAAQEWT